MVTGAGEGVGIGVATTGVTTGTGVGMETTGVAMTAGAAEISEDEVVGSFWVFVASPLVTRDEAERRLVSSKTEVERGALEGTTGFSLSSLFPKGDAERLVPLVTCSLLAEARKRGLRRMDSSVAPSPFSLNVFFSPSAFFLIFFSVVVMVGATRSTSA